MSEFFYVLKVFILTAAVTMLLQMRVGGSTLEARTDRFLTRSDVALWLQSAASGGAQGLTNLSRRVKDTITSKSDSFNEEAREQRAGR